jgi:hypothetical protein
MQVRSIDSKLNMKDINKILAKGTLQMQFFFK